jgi:hypothetical protein
VTRKPKPDTEAQEKYMPSDPGTPIYDQLAREQMLSELRAARPRVRDRLRGFWHEVSGASLVDTDEAQR